MIPLVDDAFTSVRPARGRPGYPDRLPFRTQNRHRLGRPAAPNWIGVAGIPVSIVCVTGSGEGGDGVFGVVAGSSI